MAYRGFDRGKPAGIATIGLVLALAGCQAGDTLGALNLGGSRERVPDDRITVEELTAYCPSVTVPQAGAVYSSYQRGGDGDPARLNFRASIIDATRSCTYQPGGTMSMTIAVAGRVVPGPAAGAGTVRVPLRITVYENADVIYSQTHEHDVALGGAASQFLLTDANFSMPNPTARNIRVHTSYDQPSAPRR